MLQIRANDQQTIHLVVRDAAEIPDPAPRQDPQIRHHLPHGVRNAPNPAAPRPGSAPIGTPNPAAQLHQQLHQQVHQQHLQQQELLMRMNQLHQREANYRHMLAQQQNLRAAMGAQTPQDGINNAQGAAAELTGGRNSPVGQAFRTVTREGTGPDGQRYSFRITMNNEVIAPSSAPRPLTGPGPTSDPVGQRPLSAADVRNIIHGVDATRAAQAMASAMQRNASGAHPANMAAELAHFNFNTPIQPLQPGVTTPIFPGVSRNASRAATPDTSTRSISHGSGIIPSSLYNQSQMPPGQGQPEVYILSSPTGPRGLLLSGTSEIYTSPAARPAFLIPNLQRPLFPPSYLAETHQGQAHVTITAPGQPLVHIAAPFAQPFHPAPPLVLQQPLPQPFPQAHNEQPPAIRRRPVAAPAAPAEAQPVPPINHPGNPGLAPLLAAAWPHVWLITRLVLFAWWFSYSNPSWERWLSLVLASVVVLAINTGVFNGMVNNAFHPVREQLEGMIPFADPDRQHQHQQQQGHPQPQGQQTQGEGGVNQGGANVDPARAAARLVAQRRLQNGSWLRDQMRRIERAGILFLASFAPGVAERHIQQLEERERAERRAAEEARAAAAAAAAEQEASQAAAENQEGQEGRPDEAAELQQPLAPEGHPQPPLIEV